MEIYKELKKIQQDNSDKKKEIKDKYSKMIKKREYSIMSIHEQIVYNYKNRYSNI